MIFYFLEALPSTLIVGIAVASTQQDNFFMEHPDATKWIVSSLFALVCLMMVGNYRALTAAQTKMAADFGEAQKTIALSFRESADQIRNACDRLTVVETRQRGVLKKLDTWDSDRLRIGMVEQHINDCEYCPPGKPRKQFGNESVG